MVESPPPILPISLVLWQATLHSFRAMLINPLAPTEKITEFTTVIYTNLGNPVAIGKHKELRGGWSDPLSLKKKK